jgi:hypothetical protein
LSQSFSPFSSQLGIAGTSYRLQMGRVNDKWASRILKGTDVIESTVFNDADLPNANLIVGWCLKVIAIPNINPYQVMKTVQFLRKETERNWEESKTKVVASATEAREARGKLEKVPEAELKRHTDVGWIKDEAQAGKTGEPAVTPSAPATPMSASKVEPPRAGTPASAAAVAGPVGDVQVKAFTADDKNRLRQKLVTIPGATAAPAATTSATPSTGGAAASASGGASGAVKCKSCGAEIRYCPVCGKPL